ncbi:MAG: co-chaperone GroES [Alphaproteobacteria bacterium]|nr:co-chaperone GroES [Alphaproteobacteria bacterium]
MVMRAILDRVFIRLDSKEKTTAGGIILTESHESEQTIGTVEAVGPDVDSVKVGERVLFHVFDELPTYDPDVVVVRESSLLGVFTDED